MACRSRDPGHWLHRFDAAEWLAAAETELAHAQEKLSHRSVRPGVTHARRAAGMAWNAVLVMAPPTSATAAVTWTTSSRWRRRRRMMRRSPPRSVRRHKLRDTPAAPPQLVTIGKPDMSALEAATAIVTFARIRVSGSLPAR